ncbi:hypothetical protein BCR32DRAFT_296718 [Anaeromyces robustus]|uniref:Vacuolar protein sorting-associated protein 51 homolog n=1 Tax=Anaeromyces robustus TaxID=1754192 RepID=A0A1Y1WQH0_9FUNG|nr:hypothetical protein BCR32DRAFT_296718 [Anaeromyces robustus]|eukprot:ORX75722.1 hypothetical protein BCR32DRAFT_296718 [Anaeromyces robustus]
MEKEKKIINRKNKEKARGLLKSYYGIQEKPKIKKVTRNPSDINSIAFDSNQYIKKAKKDYNMQALLKENNKLTSETKQLDSEMKGLIYDNYRKFINANDSIQNMRKEIENIDTEMNSLFDKVKNITKTSSEINNSLETSREKIHKLNNVNLLLKKLQFILELPARLNHCINQNPPQYSQAVFYYTRTEKLLKKYKDISGFSKIDEECQEIIKEISKKIKINDTTKSMKESSINIGLLIGLHFPPVQLSKEYSSYALIHLKDILTQNRITNESSEEQIKKIDKLNEEFLNELNLFIASYSSYFLKQEKNEQTNVLYTANLNENERIAANNKLMEIVEELCTEYLNIISKVITLSQNSNEIKETAYSHSLSIFKSTHSHINVLDALQKITTLNEKVLNNTIEWITNIADDLFNDCINKLFEMYYDEIDKNYSNNFETLIKKSEEFLINEITGKIVPKLNKITKEDIKELDLVLNNEVLVYTSINKSLRNFWNNIFDRITKYSSELSYRNKISPKLLLYVQFCERLRINTINAIYNLYIQELYKDIKEDEIKEKESDLASPTTGDIFSKEKEALSDISSTIVECQKLIQTLLNRYTQVVGNNLIYIAKNSFQEKLQSNKSDQISSFWIIILKQLEMYCIDINKIIYTNISKPVDTVSVESSPIKSKMIQAQYNNPYLLQNSTISSTYSSFMNPYINNDHNIMSNIDRLFTERIEYYGNVELNRINIKTNIINILLKGIIEYVRLFSFTKEDYSQIQLDTEVIKTILWNFVEDPKIFDNILEDLKTSVRVRCSEENLKKEDFGDKIQNIVTSLGFKNF